MTGQTPRDFFDGVLRGFGEERREERETAKAGAELPKRPYVVYRGGPPRRRQQTIENLLALQIRLTALGLGLGFERDGKALADAKQDVAAVFRGDLDEIRMADDVEALNLAENELGDLVGDRVADPAVHHHSELSPELVSFIESLIVVRHHSLLGVRGLPTRHVTSLCSLARRGSSHLRAWVRRAAGVSRPSGTTRGGVR